MAAPFISPSHEPKPAPGKLFQDNRPNALTIGMAVGGVKGGTEPGKTDEPGFNAVGDKVHHLNAPILHLLGFDQTKPPTRSQGRDLRLADVHGNVVRKFSV